MTDLEITQLCAEAMEYLPFPEYRLSTKDFTGMEVIVSSGARAAHFYYDPLHDDAQAMALVKKFELNILRQDDAWTVLPPTTKYRGAGDYYLNRAICLCVAKMWQAK